MYISLYVDVNTFIRGHQPQNKLMRLRTFKEKQKKKNQLEHTTTVRSWKGHRKFLKSFSAESAESYRVRSLWVHPPSSFESAQKDVLALCPRYFDDVLQVL